MEAIILAGGLGSRLQSIVSDVPKPMAPINGKPFLRYMITYLKGQGIEKIHLATFHLSCKIENEFYNEENVFVHKEPSSLGTGGSILYNLQFVESENVLIINGDTFTMVDIKKMLKFHLQKDSRFTICTAKLKDTGRFGTLKIYIDKIIEFKEKVVEGEGFINTGTYIANVACLNQSLLDVGKQNFSIEKEFFEGNKNLFAFKTKGYFIDIGIPEDYLKAQSEIPEILATFNTF